MIKYWRYFVFVLLLAGCQEEDKLNSLKFTQIDDIFYVDGTYEIEAQAGEAIEQVSLYQNNFMIAENLIPDDTGNIAFQLYVGEVATNMTLKLVGLNSDGEVVGEASETRRVNEQRTIPPVTQGGEYWTDFSFREPSSDELGKRYDLWATYYYLRVVNEVNSGTALRNKFAENLGIDLSRKDWCEAAIEGSVQVNLFSGQSKTFNFAASTSSKKVDCSSYTSINTGGVKWVEIDWKYGHGVRNYKLIPYRTIAVDPSKIPYDSILYIPAARGVEIELPDGSIVYHDGYFFAGDTGGAIKGSHIDVYLGPVEGNPYRRGVNPFSWIKSHESGTFRTYLVNDLEIINQLRSLH